MQKIEEGSKSGKLERKHFRNWLAVDLQSQRHGDSSKVGGKDSENTTADST